MRRIVIASSLLVVALVVAARSEIVPASKGAPQGEGQLRPGSFTPGAGVASQERPPGLRSSVEFTAPHVTD